MSQNLREQRCAAQAAAIQARAEQNHDRPVRRRLVFIEMDPNGAAQHELYADIDGTDLD